MPFAALGSGWVLSPVDGFYDCGVIFVANRIVERFLSTGVFYGFEVRFNSSIRASAFLSATMALCFTSSGSPESIMPLMTSVAMCSLLVIVEAGSWGMVLGSDLGVASKHLTQIMVLFDRVRQLANTL